MGKYLSKILKREYRGIALINQYYDQLAHKISDNFKKLIHSQFIEEKEKCLNQIEILVHQHSRMIQIVNKIREFSIDEYKKTNTTLIKKIEASLKNVESFRVLLLDSSSRDYFLAKYEVFKKIFCFLIQTNKSIYTHIDHEFLLVVSPFYISKSIVEKFE